MAFTGIAAILRPHGKTVHKTFVRPVPVVYDSVSRIKSQSKNTNINLPFRGQIMLLGGDFRQLLPIEVNSTRSELINLSIKFS